MTDDLISRAAAIAAMAPMLRSMISRGYAVEAIRALPAIAASQPADPVVKADSQQSVRVKPLVWHEGDEPNEWKSGPYDVWCELGKFQLYYWSIVMGEPHETAEAAKAAAQADYERRILAAIDPRDAVIKLTSEDITWITDSLRDYRIAVSRGPWDAEPMQRMLAEIDDLIDRYVAAAKGGAA